MGVHGLWKLIESSGKPVPLETLENKVLAVDVSIWLHHFIKGFQDGMGASVPNAHLLGIYHRLCKLLYFKIKPIFVFDGGVPALKKRTMELRNQKKSKNLSEADRIHKNLLSALVKHTAISKVLSEKAKQVISTKTSPIKKSKFNEDDLFVLPSPQLDSVSSNEEEETEEFSGEDSQDTKQYDLHSIDTESSDFKSLPVEVRHEILMDLKETRKQSSWGRINDMPTHSDDFSIYQMRRLLRRQTVQSALEEVEKEMGGHSLSLGELEQILKDQGVISNMKGKRIASDENTRFLLIKDLKQAVEDAAKQQLQVIEETKEENSNKIEEIESNDNSRKEKSNKGDEEFEDDLRKAIALSLEQGPSTSKEEPSDLKPKRIGGRGKNRMPLSFLAGFDDKDFDFDSESSEEETIQSRLTPAQRYMMEYSDLTPSEIAKILASKRGGRKTEISNVNVQAKDNNRTSNYDLEHQISIREFTIIDLEEERKAKIEPKNNKEVVSLQLVEEDAKNGEQKAESSVEVMSDSDSSNCDDLVEVEENNRTKHVGTMEVFIKPDEEIEDDLFKDIFEEEAKVDDTKDVKDSKKSDCQRVERVVKPNEEIDVLFGDISENQEKTIPSEEVEKNISQTSQDKIVSNLKQIASNFNSEENNERIDRTDLETKSVDKNRNVGERSNFVEESSKQKVQDLVKNYSVSSEKIKVPKLTVEQLNEMKDKLTKEQEELGVARSTKERLAGNITDQMYQEAQELLELFGVPYITAPMEAEAQCAFLELINLTDGTITDDSDIWLFGGRTVYKNFFNQSKYVLEFKSESIQNQYKLTREQMILLAMLVGSDYTIGLSGVGPVTALEILAAFPPKKHLISGLAEFKSWFQKGMVAGPGRNSLRGKLKNVSFSDSFPNWQIVDAYLEPKVETSDEKFTWAKPDVIGLVDYARQRFGWTKTKTDEILNPVLKKLEETRTQKSIKDYFKHQVKEVDSSEAIETMSKRVKKALDRIGKGGLEEEEEPKAKKKKVIKRTTKDADQKEERKPRQKKNLEKTEDEEIKFLKETKRSSKKRLQEIHQEVQKEVREQEQKINIQKLYGKEVIPQKQKDKSELLKNKLRAIEMFRKSKQGPGYVKKRCKKKQELKKDTGYLSESSSSD